MPAGLKRCGECGARSPGRRSICDLCATPFEPTKPSVAAGIATAVAVAIGWGLAMASGIIALAIAFAVAAPALAVTLYPRTRATTIVSGIVLGSAVATLAAPAVAKGLAARVEAPHVHWALSWLLVNAAIAALAATCAVVVHRIRSVEYNR